MAVLFLSAASDVVCRAALDPQNFLLHNIRMVIKSVAETSYRGMYKVSPDDGPAFFIRREYLSSVDFDALFPDFTPDDAQLEELLDAGLCSAAELKAVDYLARAEQCRAGLSRKLRHKGYDDFYINRALDYLEGADYLSDRRFARAWLNTRRTNHCEGRTRLLSELSVRGIGQDVASAAVDDFFAENDEDEICRRAYEKLSRKKNGDKLVAAMFQAGFTYRQIRAVMEG